MLHAQQESINNLKKMIACLLKKSKKKIRVRRLKLLLAKARVKRWVKTLPPNILMAMRTTLDMKILSLLLQEPKNSEDNHAKKVNELEKYLEAISHRSNLQEVGVVRPYPVK